MSTQPGTTRVIVAIAIMMSTVMYGVLVLVMPFSGPPTAAGATESLRSILYTVAVSGLLMSLFWTFTNRMPRKQHVERGRPAPTGRSAASTRLGSGPPQAPRPGSGPVIGKTEPGSKPQPSRTPGEQTRPRSQGGQSGQKPKPGAGGRSASGTRFIAARPRIAALVIAFIGYVFLAVNHQTVLNERNFYPMLLLFGPVCILFGLAGAIEPRVMSQTRIQSARTQLVFRAIMVAIVLAGLSIGWAISHYWYKIW